MTDFQLYFKLGLDHILSWSSTDHILFLIALIMVFNFKDWRKLLTLVSLFTLAHTVSLFLSVFGYIKINENLIETLILWTILITALSNILWKNQHVLTRIHYYFSFFFGLIHGLGFATDFKMMITGQSHKILPVLEFALGIETAQIILGILILIILAVLQKIWLKNMREVYILTSGLIIGYVFALLS